MVPEGSRALGRHRLPLHGHLDGPQHRHLHADGRRRRRPGAGQAPFTDEKHVFQNLGDGTYFHSGSLAIRQAIAAKVNITYKILYNDAVAMTGGQPVDGTLTVPDIAHQVRSEGVQTIVVLSDDIGKWNKPEMFPSGVEFFDRDELDAVQQAPARSARHHRASSTTRPARPKSAAAASAARWSTRPSAR